MEKKLYNLTHANDPTNPMFYETIEDALSYSDGSVFDIDDRDSYLGANVLRGPCFALALNDGLALRDQKCSRELGTICMWIGIISTVHNYMRYRY